MGAVQILALSRGALILKSLLVQSRCSVECSSAGLRHWYALAVEVVIMIVLPHFAEAHIHE